MPSPAQPRPPGGARDPDDRDHVRGGHVRVEPDGERGPDDLEGGGRGDLEGDLGGDLDDGFDGPSADGDARVPAQRAAGLDERSRGVLDFERRWWRHAGAKEQAIVDTFGLSPARYYQLLNTLVDDPAALAYDPLLVGRLRRLRVRRAGTGAPRPPSG